MQNWEYLFLYYDWSNRLTTVNGDANKKLGTTREQFYALCNRYGSAGWELVGFTDSQAAFKRPKE